MNDKGRSLLKIILIVLVALLLLAAAFAGGYFLRDCLKGREEAKEKAKMATGILKLSSSPAGLEVFVDGVSKNKKTPADLVLTPGEHRILLVSEATYDWEANVVIKKNEALSLAAFAVAKKQAETQEVEGTKELTEAEAMVNRFMRLRMKRDTKSALKSLTAEAKAKYSSPENTVLGGVSNPHYARYAILSRKQVKDGVYEFKVRIYEELSGEGEVGHFDETITVVKIKSAYYVDSIENNPRSS